jgi:predicted amidophosphoribosyltransferase
MTCSRCRKNIARLATRCPHCGEPNPGKPGTFHTSTVLISCGREDRVYRTVEDVPLRLRTQLLKSTSGGNSATILIADQRGRREIARVLRKLPAPAQRKFRQSVLVSQARAGVLWLTPARRKAIMAVVALCCLILIGMAFRYRW